MVLKEKQAVRQAVLMHGKNKFISCSVIKHQKGFTLIEILIAIAIVAIMMASLVPFLRQQPGYERKQFIARLNTMVQAAWQQAIITRAVHRVLFDFKNRTARVERTTPTAPLTQKIDFQPAQGPDMQISWSSTIIIKQFLIEGFDEMRRFAGRGIETIWFYIIPDGMTQQVTINGVDKENTLDDDRPRPFGLVLNPFLAQFKEYDTFQK